MSSTMIRPFKKPDLAAPRYRTNRLNLLNTKLYTRFIEKFPEYKDISSKDFKKVIKTLNSNIWKNAIESRDGTELPEGLGFTFIGTCPPKKKFNYDSAASMKYGQAISHRNFESDNFLAKIFYTNFSSKYKFKDCQVWKFKGYRDFTRAVGKAYPENWKKYVQIDNWQRVSKLFTKHCVKTKLMRISKIITSEYNEFAID